MRTLENVEGFSLMNCLACVEASEAVYSGQPTVQTALAHVSVEDCGWAVLVAFRGTRDPRDFLTDAECWYAPITGGRVHHGFWQGAASVVENLLQLLGRDFAYRQVVVTGHSYGAALAKLFARRLAGHVFEGPTTLHRANLHSVYTFGSPRIGDAAWARGYDATASADAKALGAITWRLVNQVDIVPRVPGLLAGYRHCGREVYLPAFGPMRFEPGWPMTVLCDAVSIALDYRNRRLGLLADHHVGHYAQRIRTLWETDQAEKIQSEQRDAAAVGGFGQRLMASGAATPEGEIKLPAPKTGE